MLLYATSADRPNVYVMTYPKVALIHILSGFTPPGPAGLCTDAAGNVYVTDPGASGAPGDVYVYKHGSTRVSRTLIAPAGTRGCALDSAGNLATVSSNGALGIFQKGRGSAAIYSDEDLPSFEYCAFDGSGRLFIDGTDGTKTMLVEFARAKFSAIALDKDISPVSLQWNGGVIVATTAAAGYDQHAYWLDISGERGRVVRTIDLRRHSDKPVASGTQTWIQSGVLLAPGSEMGRIDVWKYPQGGEQARSIHENGGYFYGLVVSVH